MNNYFGIGLDAKISLDFNTMREENPAAFRHITSRSALSSHFAQESSQESDVVRPAGQPRDALQLVQKPASADPAQVRRL